ncbi:MULTISPECIES: hypothetical protein [unclassified Streptomyces]|uniref:hypothetical protein n=1 Tax=unclassified Streptomyces TaxID=2593676 RepID=UPI002E292DE2|nr:hypothetical protein [Streptomyces sp. NBC_00304]
MTFATRITTADRQSVTVVSQTSAITDWVSRYLGLWWTAANVDPCTAIGPVIRADVDEEQHTELGARVLTGRPEPARRPSASACSTPSAGTSPYAAGSGPVN